MSDNRFNSGVKDFVAEIREAVSPHLVLTQDVNDPVCFRFSLPETPYLHSDNFVTTKELVDVVNEAAVFHFGRIPEFNNTHTSFWFNL